MLGNSRHSRVRPTAANNPAARWLKLIAILALALYLGGMGSTSPAQAAPDADETVDSFSMSMSPIPVPACAHSRYEVEAFARVDRLADRNGEKVHLEGGLGPAEIFVKASSSDTSVASFHPETRKTAALDNRIGRGADFVLKTEAPGSATLTLTVALTSAGERVTFPPLQQSIKVVNCRFRVTINSLVSGIGPAITQTVVAALTGEMTGDADGTLTGEAEVTWNGQQATPCLAVVQTAPPSKATLEGSLSEDGSSLTVRVTYGQGMWFSTGTTTCQIARTVQQQGQFQPAPQNFTVPTTGSVLSQPVSLQMGTGAPLSGTAIISVVPIEEQ